MKVLITGGAGMVGSHCAEYFARGRNKVIVYDNLMRSKIFASKKKTVEFNWHYLHQYKNIDFFKNDIRDIPALEKCFKKYKPDVVIHTAGQPGVRFSLDDPKEDFDINAIGTVNVLEAMRKSNPKGTFIYCSTNKVYGEHVNHIPLKKTKLRYDFKTLSGISEEQSIDLVGHTPYGVSKLAGDLYVQDYAHTYGLKTAVFRMSCIYGTRQFGFEDQGWIAWFSICYLLGAPISIYGDGKQVRDVLWVEDLINAYDKFIHSPLKHGVFNIGGGPGNTLSLLELIQILKKITGKDVKISFKDWRKFDQKVYISSIRKVQTQLDWKPTVPPPEGVSRIIHWLQGNRGLI
jgi:CDP-paratose 2-epimerase